VIVDGGKGGRAPDGFPVFGPTIINPPALMSGALTDNGIVGAI